MTFLCKATGNTYRVKNDLMNWGFHWNADEKYWQRECVDISEQAIFQAKLKTSWAGVNLRYIQEDTSVSDLIEDSK